MAHSKKNLHLAYLLVSFVGLLISCRVVLTKAMVMAQVESNSIEIAPTYQEISIDDTQASASGSLVLTNSTQSDQEFEVFALEISQFGADGRVILADKPLDGNQSNFAQFVEFDQEEVSVPAQQQRSVRFAVKNTPRLSPGGHYAAVVARLRPQSQQNQQVLPAVSSFLLIRKIGGEIYHLSLGQISLGRMGVVLQMPKKIELVFTNQGNIHITPRGTVAIKDIFGKTIYHGAINVESSFVFPETQRAFTTTIKKTAFGWPVMLYQVTIDARSEPGTAVAHQSASFIYLNWVASTLCLSVLAIIFLVVILKHRRE